MRLAPEVLDASGPTICLGRDADDLARGLVREQDDTLGVAEHERLVGLEHRVRERVVLPLPLFVQHAACRRSALIVEPEAAVRRPGHT